MKKQVDKTTEVSTKKVTEPFTMLLLGVDSPTEDISKASGLGDSIMLVTFNPKTLLQQCLVFQEIRLYLLHVIEMQEVRLHMRGRWRFLYDKYS